MHPVYLLAFATFALILGFLAWNKLSVKRSQVPGQLTGPGGVSDPLSGEGADVRPPDEMRASMDAAAGNPRASYE